MLHVNNSIVYLSISLKLKRGLTHNFRLKITYYLKYEKCIDAYIMFKLDIDILDSERSEKCIGLPMISSLFTFFMYVDLYNFIYNI